MNFNELLRFDKMITPRLISILYWLLLLGVVVSGFGSMFVPFGFSFGAFLRGLFLILIGAILVRVWCELLIVVFKINGNLQAIREQNQNKS